MIASPTATFAEVVRDPRPLEMVVFVAAITAAAAASLLSTDIGRLAWLDEAMRQADVFGLAVSDAEYAQLRRVSVHAAELVLLQDLIGVPLVMMAGAAILKAAFRMIAPANATWKQTLGVLAASSVILAIRQIVIVPINYIRESMTSTTNLAMFLPVPPGTLAARLLGMIDVFAIWWLTVLAIGLGKLFGRPARRIAVTLWSIYVAAAIALGIVLMVIGG